MMECLVADCAKPSKTRGMCGMHAERARSGAELLGPPRWSRVDFDASYRVDESGCWIWTRALASTGYGRIGKLYAHRVSYERVNGPIPEGLHIDHLCRVTACVNPDHLEAVTPRENMLRGDSPGGLVLRLGVCKRGHEYTPENTYWRRDKPWRNCRTCHREHERARQRRLSGKAS